MSIRYLICLCQCLFSTQQTTFGKRLNSSSYSDGYFRLLVSMPTELSYTCRLPVLDDHVTCFDDNSRDATLVIDKVAARLTILEGERDLLKKVSTLSSQSVDCRLLQTLSLSVCVRVCVGVCLSVPLLRLISRLVWVEF